MQIISKYKEHLQYLYTVDELCVPEFISLDQMADVFNTSTTMFNWYHSIVVGLLFQCSWVYFWISFLSLWYYKVAMQQIEY